MSLVGEHRQQIEAYLAGRLSLPALQDWLGETAVLVDHAHDTKAKRLAARAWRLISEYSAGHRDEASVRDELASDLREERTSTSGTRPPR